MAALLRVGPDALLRVNDLVFPCRLGRAGRRADKVEGDGATPIGRFPLRTVFYRPDRGEAPAGGLPVRALDPSMGWCDDPADPAYNQPVTLPYRASAETLWRDDDLYDIVVVLGHNDDPVVVGAGSAIFLHVAAADGRPTAGCVALAVADLRRVLALCDENAEIEISP
ncbi:L,D-transpeptidase family protein [Rhodospirillum rubrum]|uniref:L,D-TPase catalytic domain-containing protein n=1 Tax=Rhodospirillum rubrum (strain ATCC 11170 / ATH 1.1.1 / DSM 467 / LMG 4362 / NCIMB 8255 / S1) TaxID=269796 RepID=Q2RN66_RHORT|nr:L,D-transpeptidase family protein [Rhodospirillum rubrum]ABC24429.1 conserved hypothetical protein [Rhodospirillum rubrum ATCC 11170]AEO50180.1 hypothetical protein F11_18600 [Rhodospirillum rubrum F11]MBK5956149.1 hypothetical protein [Rhodospirillum rubrum]QXG80351.1 L,D-transpeptidase family protein [Rhodospirillum rubrum]HAP99433.1 hypothetical protein [Rhodospirillum rubrum]